MSLALHTTSSITYQDGINADNIITSIGTSPPPSKKSSGAVKYMECLKNHAVSIGGNATDGCGEFMNGGQEGTIEALKCSACNCHRNFHRKTIQMHAQVPSASGVNYDLGLASSGHRREGGGKVEKRFRTKFTREQKEKMLGFAEEAGWKLTNNKVDDYDEVMRFCEEIGVNRKVLKVWMHNNKYHFAKRDKSS